MAKPITIKITGDATGFRGALNDASSALTTFGGKAGKALLGIGAGIATAGIAVGAGLVKMGADLDKAYDTIIVGTGASGEALDVLKEDFAAVAAKTPASLDQVGVAIADLNTRLGLTGEPLQKISEQMLDLSRLTGQDLSSTIANVTRMFGDAGIATEDQSRTLDLLFEATKRTGIGLDRLTTLTVQYGAPLRQMGFEMEESVALFSKFEQEGVNVETVMAGMRAGLGKLAKAGEEPAEAFTRLVDEIQNAKTNGEATAIAIETFGQRAGPDMAAAIREGRFEIADLVAGIQDSEGALQDAADRTESFGEKWQIIKNRVITGLAPLATKAFDAIGTALDKLGPYVDVAVEWFREVLPPVMERLQGIFETYKEWIVANWPQISAVIVAVTGVIQKGLQKAAEFVEKYLPPALELLGDIFRAVVGWITDNWPTISTVISTVIETVRGVLSSIIEWTRQNWPTIQTVITTAIDAVSAVLSTIVEWVQANWPRISETFLVVKDAVVDAVTLVVDIVSKIVDAFRGAADGGDEGGNRLIEIVKKVLEFFQTAFEAIAAVVEKVVAVVTWIWNKWGDEIMAVVKAAFEFVIGAIENVLEVFTNIFGLIKSIVTGDWSGMWDAVKGILSGVWDLIKGTLSFIKDSIVGVFGGLVGSVKDKFVDMVDGAIDFLASVPGRFLDAAKAIGSSILDGIKNGLSGAINFVGDIIGAIKNALIDAVNWLITKMNDGIPNQLGWGPLAIDLPDNPIPLISKAMGGPASGRVLVGERGPEEVFLPRGSRVVPNHALAPAGDVIVNVTSNADPHLIGRELAWVLKTAGV